MSTTSQDSNHRTLGLATSSSAPFGHSGLSGIVEGLRNLLEGRKRWAARCMPSERLICVTASVQQILV